MKIPGNVLSLQCETIKLSCRINKKERIMRNLGKVFSVLVLAAMVSCGEQQNVNTPKFESVDIIPTEETCDVEHDIQDYIDTVIEDKWTELNERGETLYFMKLGYNDRLSGVTLLVDSLTYEYYTVTNTVSVSDTFVHVYDVYHD